MIYNWQRHSIWVEHCFETEFTIERTFPIAPEATGRQGPNIWIKHNTRWGFEYLNIMKHFFLTMYKLVIEYNLQYSAFPYWHQEAGDAAKCTDVKSKLLHD